MAAEASKQSFIDKRLCINREAELLQSYVRLDDDDDESTAGDPKPSPETKSEEVTANKDVKEGDGRKLSEEAVKVALDEVKKVRRKKKRANCRREELYCDKDRAAAVNMGSKDIKQSLKLKRKQDRSKNLQIPEEAEPATFLALGNYKMCRGDLKIALNFITKALELNPTEKGALVARSKCYILLGQPENALKDAETALNIDKHFLKGIYQKAEALYYLGDFEHSLMYYHRGLHLRPEHDDFTLGVHKAQKAIENAIGSPLVFARLMKGGTKTGSSATKSVRSRSKTTCYSTESVTSEVTAKNGKNRKSRLLRELAPDKEYLDNLMKNPHLKCKFNKDESNESIVKTIEETVEYLNARQEFWRQQLPAHLK